jgi:tetratricopeptide (TPR) repeat protein
MIQSERLMIFVLCLALPFCAAWGGEQAIQDTVWCERGGPALAAWRNTLGSVERSARYLEENPDSGVADDILLATARLVRVQGKPDEAIRLLDRLIRDYPDHKRLYIGYLNQAEKHYETPAVLARYRAALLTFPVKTSDLAQFEEAKCLEALGKSDKARTIYERIEKAGPSAERKKANHAWLAHLLLGYEDPFEDALAALVRLDFTEGKIESARARTRALADYAPASVKSLAAIDACLEFAFQEKRTVDDPEWSQLRRRTVVAARATASEFKTRNELVERHLSQALHDGLDGVRDRFRRRKESR